MSDYPEPYGPGAPPYAAGPGPSSAGVPPGYPAPVSYERAVEVPVGPPVAPSPAQYFSSPEQEAAGKHAHGQAAFNEQDEFNDPTGKYKLVMKGA
jgi:hypothetical protein